MESPKDFNKLPTLEQHYQREYERAKENVYKHNETKYKYPPEFKLRLRALEIRKSFNASLTESEREYIDVAIKAHKDVQKEYDLLQLIQGNTK